MPLGDIAGCHIWLERVGLATGRLKPEILQRNLQHVGQLPATNTSRVLRLKSSYTVSKNKTRS